jgi:putative redox protein
MDVEVRLPPHGRVMPSVDAALAEPLIAAADTREAVIRSGDLTGMDFRARAPSGHERILDTDPGSGGHGRGIQPKEMLLVALAGCTGMDVIAILRKKRQVVTDYRVRVVATQRPDHPQVYTQIVVQHIVSGPTLDPAAVARAVELSVAKYCSVHAMLSAACPITHEFRIVLA